jgi:tryptophan 7-halogenase
MTASRTSSVAVLGGGIAGTAAAAAFRRALPGAEVTLFAGGAGEPEYLGAAAPSIHEFHRLIGIQPELFRRRAGAVVAREAEIRRASRAAVTMVPLSEMPHIDGAALHQLWLRRTAADAAGGPPWEEVAGGAPRPPHRAE